MKLKITFLLLLVSFLGHAQLTNNMVVLKPIVFTPSIATVSGPSGTLWGAYNANTGQSSVWGTNNFNRCNGGGYTLTYSYTGGNGISYASKSWGLNGGGTITLPAGTLANGSGTLTFNFWGTVPAAAGWGTHTYLTDINVFGKVFKVTQSAYTVSVWNNGPDTFLNCP